MAENEDPRWGTAQRYEFIEWRIYWVGRVNRADIQESFRLSTPQASIVLNEYLAVAPDNIRYDKTQKAYVPTDSFRPKYLKLSADRYLRQLEAIFNFVIPRGNTWFGSIPPVAVVQTVLRRVEPTILHAILSAIKERLALEITYQSLTNTRDRYIVPHSLAFDGFRWHVRAWCAEKRDFRDFVLSRILSTGRSKPSLVNPALDIEWHSYAELKIIAHPKLSEAQRSVIERDFGMTKGVLKIKTRTALAEYAIKGLNLDLSDDAIEPARKQISLVNLAEVRDAIAAARRQSAQEIAKLME